MLFTCNVNAQDDWYISLSDLDYSFSSVCTEIEGESDFDRYIRCNTPNNCGNRGEMGYLFDRFINVERNSIN